MAELEQKEGQEQVTTPESKSEDKNSYQKRIDELVSAKKAAEAKTCALDNQ